MGTTPGPATPAEITFAVAGEELPPAGRQTPHGQVRQAVRLGATRAAGRAVQVKARPGEDVVRLAIGNGPTLVLHPEHARELLAAQRRDATRGAPAADGALLVSAELGWPGAEGTPSRAVGSWLAQATLESIEVVSDVGKDLAMDAAVDGATGWLARRVDGQVNPGVYAVPPQGFDQPFKQAGKTPLAAVPAAADGGPTLVLVHGTFVESHSTFGKLWAMHPDQVRRLFDAYRGCVYALDHPTLGTSPVQNALTLVAALPQGARLHLLTHSRGGLVAEVLARACSGPVPPRSQLDAEVPEDAADLERLFSEARAKDLRVERMVRVACPARGTLLASRRLDAYLSVLTWALQLGGQVVLSTLVEFLHGIAKNRADFDQLPGIKAMMPESPFIAWLCAQDAPIAGDLRVVAGDIQADSMVSWLKTLLADAYYWTDNDLVVHTRAMYGGVPRGTGGARFLLDRGGKVSHFTYFSNLRTAGAVVDALLQPSPSSFAPIGPRSWAGEDASGTRARVLARDAAGTPPAQRPAVFVLPGILGSNIALDGQRLWLGWNFVNGLLKLRWDEATAGRFSADGPIAEVYDALITRLADSHEVIPFAYDWRRPIEDEAQRLADALEQALALRDASRQPVRILTHSMGALVARTMRLLRPQAWQSLMQRPGARVLMLGPPNAGSWAPMQTLTGDDGFGNALVAVGSLFQNAQARAMMAGLPGFLQLQAGLLDPQSGLQDAATWQELARRDIEALTRYNTWHQPDAQQAVYGWSAPPQDVLDRAVDLQRKLAAQVPDLQQDAGKLLIVLGRAAFTPGGYDMGESGLAYVAAAEGGDGRVPQRSAQLPGVPMWKVDAPHGKLPQATQAFAGYLDLLTQGSTTQLERVEPVPALAAVRSGPASVPGSLAHSRPSRRFQDAAPPASPSDLMDTTGADSAARTPGDAQSAEALAVRVINGDIQFVPEPLLVGHYRSLQLTGSERVLDRLVGGVMGQSLATGLYPDATGSNQIFANERRNPDDPLQMARPHAAVVAGLGEEGKLTADRLAFTVRQAVLAYAQRLSERQGGAPASFELCATLVGSGGTRVTPGISAQSVVQGVLDANLKLAAVGWPRLAQLTIVELFLERAVEAWHAVRQQQDAWSGRLQVQGQVVVRDGAMRRPLDAGYRGSSYDLITVVSQHDGEGHECLAFDLDTKRARTEVRAQHAQTALVRSLVASASNQANDDPQIGRTLFNLLVPPEIEPYLAGTNEMVLEVDRSTAVIPWELLQSNPDATVADKRPWAVRSRLVRKLRTDTFRERVVDATAEDAVLVIGEPEVPADYPPLEGALREAEAVVRQLQAQLPAGQVEDLLNRKSGVIVNTLFARSWRILHVAGHGAPGPDGGVVLSGNTFLDASVVDAMRTVPELVFLNCCHLAGHDAKNFGSWDRASFAANVSEKLIEIGVRCVIAAGWAVEDGPAEIFATRFYQALLGGARFIDAVGEAREAAWQANPQGNTWAAYQCYGDPSWSWTRERGNERSPGTGDMAAIASVYGLELALENLTTEVRYRARTPEATLDRIRKLEAEHGGRWGEQGKVAQAFGLAYAEAGAVGPAAQWLQRAVAADDGSASLRAAEQLANVQARQGERVGDAEAIRTAIAALERLAAIGPTRERVSLLGSASKRLAMVSWQRRLDAASPEDAQQAGSEAAKAARQAQAWYARAQDMATAAGAVDAFYPARNALAGALVADMMQGRAPRMQAAGIEAVERLTRAAASTQPDFWSVAGVAELQLLKAIVRHSLQRDLDGILAEFRDLKERVQAPWRWDSLYAEARFMLGLYRGLEKTAAGEKEAADTVLAELAGYATPPA